MASSVAGVVRTAMCLRYDTDMACEDCDRTAGLRYGSERSGHCEDCDRTAMCLRYDSVMTGSVYASVMSGVGS